MITLNGTPIIPTKFPDGTQQVWHLTIPPAPHVVVWQYESDAEFIALAQLCDLIQPGTSTLELPYLPYGRQDKPVSVDATFGLTSFAYLLNFLAFGKVRIFDPHSEQAAKLIWNCEPVMPDLTKLLQRIQPAFVVYPDAGAWRKYSAFIGHSWVAAKKVRDPATGAISKLELQGSETALQGQDLLIVDDICDGGATFVALAALLYQYGARAVDLYVSHGLFTKGKQLLYSAGIRNIYTKDDL